MPGGPAGVGRPQLSPSETVFADELRFLAAWDSGGRPPGWRLTPRAVVTFIVGSDDGSDDEALHAGSRALSISPKFVGDRALIERCVVTLAGERGLLLVGEPGTAKSMLSELLAAAISGTSALTVQGTAGTSEEHLRYGWNYALLIARGPHPEALVPSPMLTAHADWAHRTRRGGDALPARGAGRVGLDAVGTTAEHSGAERRRRSGVCAGRLQRDRDRQLAGSGRLGDVGGAQATLQLRDWSSRSAISSSSDAWSSVRRRPPWRAAGRRSPWTRRCWRRW